MKKEFLQNLKVGGQALPDDVVQAILDENGRDVEAAKAPYADYDSIKDQLDIAKKNLKEWEGVDVKELQGKITTLQADLTAKEADYQGKLADMAFDHALEKAITGAQGRNAKAIAALLDVPTLKASKNQEADIKAALEGLKKDNGYLFGTDEKVPPYAGGTGTGGGGGSDTDVFNFGFTGIRSHDNK
jgi:hypothetical protein